MVGKHIGVVRYAAGVADSLGTRAVGVESSGAVDKVESVSVSRHFERVDDCMSRDVGRV